MTWDSRAWRLAVPLVAFAGLVVLLRLAAPAALRGSVAGQPISSPSASPQASPASSPTGRRGIPAVRSTEGYACPPSAPVAAYGVPRGFHFFPPNHPRHPDPSIQPDGCYRAAADAESDGFTLGLPPQSWFDVNGLFLAPDWDLGVDLFRACDRAADELGFPVPCIHLLPAPGEISGLPRCGTASPPNPRCIHRTEGAEAFFLQYRAFPGTEGRLSGGAGLTVAAFPASSASSGSELELLFLCGGQEPSGWDTFIFPWSHRPTTFRGAIIECPEGAPPSGGQRLLRWNRAGIVNVLGLPAELETEHEGLLMQIALSTEFVPPSR